MLMRSRAPKLGMGDEEEGGGGVHCASSNIQIYIYIPYFCFPNLNGNRLPSHLGVFSVVVVVCFFSFEKFHCSFTSPDVLFPTSAIYVLCALKKGKQITQTKQFVARRNRL